MDWYIWLGIAFIVIALIVWKAKRNYSSVTNLGGHSGGLAGALKACCGRR